MTDKAKRHNLSDWLALHDLDPSLCRQILSAAAGQGGGQTVKQQEPTSNEYGLDADIAWLRVVDAMCAFFPAQRNLISDTYENIAKVRVNYRKDSLRALTLDAGSNGYPVVLYTYRGKYADLLVVVHEFSHALQIVASRGRFVTPIIREICAFVGEMALLSRAKNTDRRQYAKLHQIWGNDDKKYFTSDGSDLLAALTSPNTGYRYCWNYPVARSLTAQISERYSRERIWMLFEGNLSVAQILDDLGR